MLVRLHFDQHDLLFIQFESEKCRHVPGACFKMILIIALSSSIIILLSSSIFQGTN